MNPALPMLHFEDEGGEDRPALLLVHGLLASRNQWLPNLARLGRIFRLVRIDLPCHGRSPVASPQALHPDRIVAAIEDLRVRLRIERWYICGQSLGAGVTLRYALTHPQRVVAQAFTNTNAALVPPAKGPALDALLARAARIREGGMEGLRAERVHPRHARRYPENLRAILVEDAEALDPRGIADVLEHTSPHLGLADRLGEITVPTLLINGANERRFQERRDFAAARLPGLRIIDLPGGHSVNAENAEGFDAAMTMLPTLAAGL